jgi:serine/threonine-protein kinase
MLGPEGANSESAPDTADLIARSNLGAIFETGDVGGRPYIAAELVQDVSAPATPGSFDRLPPERAANQLGPFRLVRKLGQGGMAAVYLGVEPTGKRQVAIKVLPKQAGEGDDSDLRRFSREAAAAIRLVHPNLVRGVSLGEDRGRTYYVMEYLEGETLDERLKREGRIPWAQALELVAPIAEALAYAHGRGLVHRDVKPSNILITKAGTPKLLDLGISKNVAASSPSFRTESGVVLGTPYYISPEQARAEEKIDGRADLYSLGATLYHLVTGRVPFQAPTPLEILAQHLNAEPPDPRLGAPDLPEGVVLLLQRMLRKSPLERHRDGAELAADLKRVRRGKRPGADRLPRRAGLWIGAAAVAAVLAFLLIDRMGEEPPRPPAPGAPVVDKATRTINLLKDVDPARHAVAGSWSRTKDGLVCARSPFGRIGFAYEPPEEYDYLVEFTRHEGRSSVAQFCGAGRSGFAWEMGVFGNIAHGFFARSDPPGATVPPTPQRDALSDGRRYRSLVQVRKGGCKAFLDDQLRLEWTTDFSTLRGNPAWALGFEKELGLGADESAVVFHRAEVREISGAGRTRPRTSGPPSGMKSRADLPEVYGMPPGFQDEGLIARWSFDERGGPVVFDSSGSGHHGVLVGYPPEPFRSKFAPPVRFPNPGSNVFDLKLLQHVEVPDHPSLNVTGSFSVSAWVRPTLQGQAQNCVLEKFDWTGEAASGGFSFRINKNGHVSFYLHQGKLGGICTAPRSIVLGTWSHVAGVYDAAERTVRIYVNGKLDPSAGLPEARSVSPPIPAKEHLRIGCDYAENGFNGYIDDVRLYGRALSAAEVWRLTEGHERTRSGGK